MRFSSAGCRVEHQKVVVHLLVDFHDSSFVAASVTVVRSAKDGHNLLVVTVIITLQRFIKVLLTVITS